MNQASQYRKPDYRGVVRGGKLSLVDRSESMPQPFGYAGPSLREGTSGVIVDLEVIHDGDALELVVTEITRSQSTHAREAIIAFAKTLGYRRVWFTDDVIELDPFSVLGVEASTTCSACGTTFREDQPEFMLIARRRGVWPVSCPLDGHPLPQWMLESRPVMEERNAWQSHPPHARS